MTVCILLDP